MLYEYRYESVSFHGLMGDFIFEDGWRVVGVIPPAKEGGAGLSYVILERPKPNDNETKERKDEP